MTNMCLLFLTVTYNVTLDYSHQSSTCNVRILKKQQDSSAALHFKERFCKTKFKHRNVYSFLSMLQMATLHLWLGLESV